MKKKESFWCKSCGKPKKLIPCECYFDDHGCAYIYNGNIKQCAKTIPVSFKAGKWTVDVNVDLGADGKIVGVEVLI